MMKASSERKWTVLFTFFFVLFSFALSPATEGASRKRVGNATCIDCHQGWPDNNPPADDVARGNASLGYVPPNLMGEVRSEPNPFYSISDGYGGSVHHTPSFNPAIREEVKCEDCHGGGTAHFGLGPIPNPIPNTATCAQCHKQPYFDIETFLKTAHANPNNTPGRFFDQKRKGRGQAITAFPDLGESYALYHEDRETRVTRNQRIEECSVCHQYALPYPQFVEKIAQGILPKKNEVGCGACHDSHIPAPNGRDPARVNTTVQVTALSGSTVLATTPVEGRSVTYLNHKPYKVDDTGAQNLRQGVWTRGSAIAKPSTNVIKGVGTISSDTAIANRLTFPLGGFAGKVKPFDTIFISGEAFVTVNLPSNAVNPGAPVTVKAIFDRAGFEVEEVLDDTTLLIAPRSNSAAIAQLGTDQIAAVAQTTLTYRRTPSGTGTLTVFVPFTGSFAFEIRDMYTNTEALCSSCHTQGRYKYTAWGKRTNKGASASSGGSDFIDLGATHNQDIGTQYRSSGHASRTAAPFEEFSAFPYGSTHQTIYPFDMSITGSGGLGSLRNKGNTSFELTQTPDPNNAYFSVAGNTFLPTFINNYACYQCHHGLGSIDYQKDIQGTSQASVLWGDATVTCVTCHDPHDKGAGAHVRTPVKLSYNSRFVDAVKNPRGGINKFMDGTDIPSTVGKGALCLFCHQGRESGLTVYMAIKSKVDPYTNPNQVIDPAGVSFINPHYLDGGSILWSRNAWEYFFDGVPQTYSKGIPAHQELNCTGCHMAEPKMEGGQLAGGHTWRPHVETCKKCHGEISDFREIPAIFNYDGNNATVTTYEKIGTVVKIVNPGDSGGTGLFGKLNRALADKGIYYDPDRYPYFFTAPGGSTQFRAFTSATLSAAFNLSWAWKAGNCTYYHNAFYVAQILQDSLKALGVALPPEMERPSNIFDERPATDYRTIVVNP